MKFFATTAKGTERALADELRELRLSRVRAEVGGVSFSGRWEDAWRACLESRIAVRVLHPIDDIAVRGERDLYEGVRQLEWEEHVSVQTTLAVSAVGQAPGLDNTMFVAQRTKDAIVDRLRDRLGARPSVSRDDPDVAVFVRLYRGRASIALDLVGEPLHKRGYRERGAAAPLKETLAAALVRLSGWDRQRPLTNPMCGSATLAIEADLWARRVAPGARRERFGFERWSSFDDSRRRRIALLRQRARDAELGDGPHVLATDADDAAVSLARRSVERASAHVRVERGRVGDLVGTSPPGWVIVNPPYGERLAADPALWRELERGISRLGAGHRVALLLGPKVPFQPPRHAERYAVFNGALRCSFAVFDV